ncbi:hypothetical protein BDA96_04G109200 [Sorghum bicolor]|uniref:Uncharacterized protein n=2 Tax=Sorghum bicolor TaxID=4558 RepID=A0A921R4E2_SORBI|nr:hypothetical protein BDA96_04G109200 [Sorghum bicolor]KAG0532462.1 hypothetical protein BDA96_04G109200 [Sorghum bicolor]OQU84675.1 hypothetical protein SORBI_3004G101250 [Sorghum bicolor]
MEILNLLANDQAAGSTKCLANVAEGSNDCNDHVQMAFPVAAILMAEHRPNKSVLRNFLDPIGRCAWGTWCKAVRWCPYCAIRQCWLVATS